VSSHAAKLFVDFLLSREGRSMAANVIGTYPANSDVMKTSISQNAKLCATYHATKTGSRS